jgi:hypothetical protein
VRSEPLFEMPAVERTTSDAGCDFGPAAKSAEFEAIGKLLALDAL